jgi:hypothetical protein
MCTDSHGQRHVNRPRPGKQRFQSHFRDKLLNLLATDHIRRLLQIHRHPAVAI